GNRPALPLAKENPAARPIGCGVSSNTPGFLRREAPAFKGWAPGRRFPAEMSALKCHIESDDCLLDPRLIDPSFLRCPAAPLARLGTPPVAQAPMRYFGQEAPGLGGLCFAAPAAS